MRTRILPKPLAYLFFISLLILGMQNVSFAADFWLRAEVTSKTMPDGTTVPMWGYAECAANHASCPPATVPGPVLTVPAGDSTLTIHLLNALPVATSIVIPGQITAMTPVHFTDVQGRARVQSFTHETPAGNTTAVAYTWSNVKPGTYLYQSGTHAAVQVQMGLYGAMKRNAAANQAYATAASAFQNEAVLIFSEIDPLINTAVSGGFYGPGFPISSTMNFEPKYFLINGKPYSPARSAEELLQPYALGQRVLLRFLNAGLHDHAPVVGTYRLTVLAEDGNLLPYTKDQHALLLPAGKTMDAIIDPTSYGYIALYDRMLSLTNGTSFGGGMLAYLKLGDPTQYQLSVSTIGSGRVIAASAPGGIDCGTDCTESYNSGTTLRLTAVPAAGQGLGSWACTGGNCSACTGTGDCIVTMTANTSVSASFAQVYTITATAGTGGSISPSGAVSVITGTDQNFSIIPAPCYHIADVRVDGASIGVVTSYTFTNVVSDRTIAALFERDTFTVTATAGPNGSIVPSGALTVTCGGIAAFEINPNAGYHVADVLVDGISVGAVASYSLNNVIANHTVDAVFAVNTYAISGLVTTAIGGAPVAGVALTLSDLAATTAVTDAAGNYSIAGVINGTYIVTPRLAGQAFTPTVSTVVINGASEAGANFTVNPHTVAGAVVGGGGTIFCTSPVDYGGSSSCTVTPAVSYQLSALTDNAVDVLASVVNNTYSIVNVIAGHTVAATFSPVPDLQVAQASLNFGGVLLFRTKIMNVEMSNIGLADLIVSNAEILGPDAAMFQVTNWAGPRTIVPGGSSSLSVVFRPTARGPRSATLRITSNDPDTPALDVPLSGTGL